MLASSLIHCMAIVLELHTEHALFRLLQCQCSNTALLLLHSEQPYKARLSEPEIFVHCAHSVGVLGLMSQYRTLTGVPHNTYTVHTVHCQRTATCTVSSCKALSLL